MGLSSGAAKAICSPRKDRMSKNEIDLREKPYRLEVKNFSYFPLKLGTKRPLGKGWYKVTRGVDSMQERGAIIFYSVLTIPIWI